MKTKLYLFFVIVAIFTYGFSGYSIAQTSEIIIGNETNLNKQFPINRMTNYSRCELIYTQQEIGQVGWINEISFYKGNDGAGGDISNVKVYIKTTSDYELYNGLWDTTGYKEVFSGIITNGIDQGWRTIILSEPYLYTGDENLAITVEHGFQAMTNDAPLWQYTKLENGTKRCRIGFNDNQIPDSLFNRVGRPNLRILMAPIETETDFLTIGTETKGSKLFPINRQFNYSRWEGLYTSDELGPEGVIYSIAFYKTNTFLDGDITNIKVYIKHTTQTEFNNDGDWLADGYTVVYEGSLSDDPNPGWRTITLTQPFRYNGNDNLAITVDHGYQLFTDNYPEWQYSKTTGKMSRVGNKDNQMPVKLNEKTGRPNIKLDIGCKLPIAHAGVDHFICGGDSVILGDSIAATGGFSPYTYKWEPDKWMNSTSMEHPTVSPLETISYNLVVADNVGCKSFPDKVTVYVNSPNDEFSFRTDTTIKVCQGRFFDSGGEKSEYKYNEDYTVTIYPCDVYNKVVVNFLKFDLEYGKFCNDYLAIYDGPNTNSPLIGSYCGVNSPGYVNSTNPDGALTFVFHSDKDVTSAGWVADIKCEKKSCTELAGTPVITFDGDFCEPGMATVSLTNNIATFLYWEYSQDNKDFKEIPGGNINPYSQYVKSTTYIRAVVENNGEKCYTSSVVFKTGNKYYVNDHDKTNDIYCTITGSDKLDGLSPETPKETIQAIFDSYDIKECDTIFVDAGIYPGDIHITASDFGSPESKIVVYGASTELTTIASVNFSQASFVKISNLAITSSERSGISVSIVDADSIDIDSCKITQGRKNEIYITGKKLFTKNIVIQRCILDHINTDNSALSIFGNVENCTVLKNKFDATVKPHIPVISIATDPYLNINNILIDENQIKAIDMGIAIIDAKGNYIRNIQVSNNNIELISTENPNGGCIMAETVYESLSIFNNRLIGGYAGIQFKIFIEGSIIYNNYFSQSQYGIISAQEGFNQKLYFNSFNNNKENINFKVGNTSQWSIKNNIFNSNQRCLFLSNEPVFSELDNNLYFTTSQSEIFSINNEANKFYNLSDWQNYVHEYGFEKDDSLSIFYDPKFKDANNNNLEIEIHSPARSKGAFVSWITTDISNNPRNNPPAIGGYEPELIDFFHIIPVKDAMISDAYDESMSIDQRNTNFGSSPNIECVSVIDSPTYSHRSIFAFDLKSIPRGSYVFKANLRLYKINDSELDSNELYLETIKDKWEEYKVTWNNQPSTSNTNRLTIDKSQGNVYNLDVTKIVQNWINSPDLNNGVMLKIADELKQGEIQFASKDNPDTAKWPYLEIVFQKVEITTKNVTKETPNTGSFKINVPIGNPPYNFVSYDPIVAQAISRLYGSDSTDFIGTSLTVDSLTSGIYKVYIIDNFLRKHEVKIDIGTIATVDSSIGVSLDGNILSRYVSGNDWENAFVLFEDSIVTNSNGFVAFTIVDSRSEFIVDLFNRGAVSPETRSMSSIQVSDNRISIYNADSLPVELEISYRSGDVIMIERRSGSLVFYLNGNALGSVIDMNDIALRPAITIYNSGLQAISDFVVNSLELLPDELTNSVNYIKTTVSKVKVKNEVLLDEMDYNQTIKSVVYYDGLGRAIQEVGVKGSPTLLDVITPKVYDQYGREPKKYLTYTIESNGGYRTNALIEQNTDYLYSPFYEEQSNANFSEIVFDDSPINNVKEEGSPGNSWQMSSGHTKRYIKNFNTTNEVMIWEVNSAGDCVFSGNYYLENQLTKNEVIDEDGQSKIQFIDKNGKLIMTQSNVEIDGTTQYEPVITYNVYDNLDQLRFVIPPQAYKNMLTSGWQNSYNSSFVNTWLFSYKYDKKHRLIEKKIPGKAVEYFVYNPLGKLVAYQDGLLRENDDWLFTKYDIYGRPVITGIINWINPSTMDDRSALAITVRNETSIYYENRSNLNFSTRYGYTNNSWPITTMLGDDWTVQTVNYYDDYDFNNDGSSDYSYLIDTEFPNSNLEYNRSTIGKLTGTKVFGIELAACQSSVIFYDKKGRVIQTYTDLGSYFNNRTFNEYDFSGNILKSKSVDNVDNNIAGSGTGVFLSTTFKKRFIYDHVNRLIKTYCKVNSEDEVVLSEREYTERGELMEKKLHSSLDDGNYLQNIDYVYNKRGWLTEINRIDIPGDGITPNTDHYNDMFQEKIFYDNGFSNLQGTARYNGNISGIIWKSARDNEIRGYGFQYDGLERIKMSNYGEYAPPPGPVPVDPPIDKSIQIVSENQQQLFYQPQLQVQGTWNQNLGRYNLSDITYDHNGNILTLKRNGYYNSTPMLVDDLTYYYYGNQVKDIKESVSGSSIYGFIDLPLYNGLPPVPGEIEYQYDNNGNLISDNNKSVSNITYNYLNLPVNFNVLGTYYAYFATGEKFLSFMGTGLIKFQRGDFVYNVFNATTLDYILTEEGRIVKQTDGTHKYEYFLKDHLGNVRATFTDIQNDFIAELISEDHYYPFGSTLSGLSFVSGYSTNTNKYKFNSKEFIDNNGLNWYDYGARFYDPNTCRFTSIDPISDKFVWVNPYNYAENSPIANIDLWGLQRLDFNTHLDMKGGDLFSATGTYLYDLATDGFGIGKFGRGMIGNIKNNADYILGEGDYGYEGHQGEKDFRFEQIDLGTKMEAYDGLQTFGNTMLTIQGGLYGFAENAVLRGTGNLAAKGGLNKNIINLAEANLTSNGKTVLGHFPGYIQKAQMMKASYFDIGDAWNSLSGSQRWGANTHFLDVVAKRGDQIYLSLPKTQIRAGSFLSKEIQYMTGQHGYKWVNQWSLIKR